MLPTLARDFQYAWRGLRNKPGLAFIVVLSMAIGIGANSAVFSVVYALLIRPLPYPEPERLAAVWLHSPGIGILRDWPSPGQYIDLRNENHSFEEMALAQSRSFTLSGLDKPEPVDAMRGQSSLLRMLGAKPLLGRLFLPEEDRPGKAHTALLSHRIWRRFYSSDPNIVGKGIVLNGDSFTVIGVLRPEFLLNAETMPSEGPMDKVDVFLPLPLGSDASKNRGDENYNILVKLKPGVSVRQAQEDVGAIAARIRLKDKRDVTFGMHVVSLRDEVTGDVRRVLLVLLGSVLLVLLIACANVANLLLTRSAGREKEIAVRMALGAGWNRLARQLLTESLLLGVLGGAGGIALAQCGLALVRTMNPGNIPRLEEIRIDGAVLAFTFLVSAGTGILFGLAPVWRAVKTDVNSSLKAGGRGAQGESGFSLTRHGLRGLLVISEMAISLMLLVAAGLLVRSFAHLQAVPPGFNAENVLTMQVHAAGSKYRQEKAVAQFFGELESRVARLPGVQAEGVVSALPLTGSVGWGQIDVEGYRPPQGQELQADVRVASEDYFRAMNIPLIRGRFFAERDNAEAQQVAIIDEKFAKRFWPRGDAVGRHVWFDVKKPYTIAGVVGVVKQYGLDVDGKIAVYFPQRQQPSSGMYLVARTAADPGALSAAIVREIHSVDPGVVVYEIRPMRDRLYDSLARQRFAGAMLSLFALFALVLAAVGVYGVMSYLVSQSGHDIGLRMALGALPGNILALVMRQGMTLAVTGVCLGLAGAAAATRVMAGLLFGVSALDGPTFVVVAGILLLTAAAAAIIPSRRATRVDPMTALRDE